MSEPSKYAKAAAAKILSRYDCVNIETTAVYLQPFFDAACAQKDAEIDKWKAEVMAHRGHILIAQDQIKTQQADIELLRSNQTATDEELYELMLHAGKDLSEKDHLITEMAAMLENADHLDRPFAMGCPSQRPCHPDCPACAWEVKKKEWGL